MASIKDAHVTASKVEKPLDFIDFTVVASIKAVQPKRKGTRLSAFSFAC